MMLKTVKVANLRPNPFRRLDEYPIVREKVDTLKESINRTGFWGTICGREVGAHVEIAFGHHRLVALRESGVKQVEMIVRELSNEQMLQMMANENLQEYGTSAWVELETVRATIEAFGKGLIVLPEIAKKTAHNIIRHAVHGPVDHAYTKLTVATFLGWTRKGGKGENSLQPNVACGVAFRALDAINAGFLKETDVTG